MKRTTIKLIVQNLDRNDVADAITNLGRRQLLELAGECGTPKRSLKENLVEGLADHIIGKNPAATVSLTFDR